MAIINKLETKHIFDFNGNYKLAKCLPKEDGYYITIKCGLGGIYTSLNEWKNGEWKVLTTDDSDVIAYSKEQVSKEDVKEWLSTKLEKYRNKYLWQQLRVILTWNSQRSWQRYCQLKVRICGILL